MKSAIVQIIEHSAEPE